MSHVLAHLGRVCEDNHRIFLILLDMGVAHQPYMERKEDGGGCPTKNTHLLSFPFSVPLSLSLPPPILSLSLY